MKNHAIYSSVPGNALSSVVSAGSSAELVSTTRKRYRQETAAPSHAESAVQRLTAAEAWKIAIQSFVVGNGSPSKTASRDEIDDHISRLGSSESYVESVPRKYKTFQRYLERNRKRVLAETMSSPLAKAGCSRIGGNANSATDSLAEKMFLRIQERQRPPYEPSAIHN